MVESRSFQTNLEVYLSQFFDDFLPIFPKELSVFVTLASQKPVNCQLDLYRDYLTTIPVPLAPLL